MDNAPQLIQERSAPPATLVIFGASGDLTKRKLIPALYHRFKDGQFDEQSRIAESRNRLGTLRASYTTFENITHCSTSCAKSASSSRVTPGSWITRLVS